MKKITSVPMLLIILTILTVGCSGFAQDAPSVLSAAENTAEDGIVEVAAPLPQTSQTNNIIAQSDDDVVTELTYIDIYKRVNPAVVNIQVIGESSAFQLEQIIPDIPEHEGDDFDDYLEDLPEGFDPEDLPDIPSSGQGSGFVIDKEGHIVTNNHVVVGAQKITVVFADGSDVEAEIVGTDPGSDLAVIKVDVEATRLFPVLIGDSASLEVGQLVATIGNPFGLDGSMSTGIVAGLGRTLPGATAPGGSRFNIPNIIQTDAAINPGNSGGPLLNLDGEVIGVNTAIQNDPSNFSFAPSFGGVGYAVPADILNRVVPQLIENGEVATPWLGVSGGTIHSDVAEAMGLNRDQQGVLVHEVLEGGPASKAGLRGSNSQVNIDGFDVPIGGDVIVQIDDQPVNEFEDLLSYIVTRVEIGKPVELKLIRDGELIDVTVTMEVRPSSP
ncbi:MAG: PDZ domain-containing protein [Chloroflexi bacterium]|nr:PDZ domain-containing protein [Chloroflexota bacterium]